jgi:vacuolar-type H+-ATPase subunit I/STV1
VIYLFRNKKGDAKNICTNDEECDVEICEYEKKKNKKTDRVFEGRFVTDEEYLQIKNSKRSDISILLEEVNSEYEHLKELNK